ATSNSTTQSSPIRASSSEMRPILSTTPISARSARRGPLARQPVTCACSATPAVCTASVSSATFMPVRRSADLLHHGIDKIAADGVAEVLVDALGRLAVGGAVDLVDGEALFLQEFGRFLGLVHDGLAPVGTELGRSRADGFLQRRREAVHLALA